MQDYLLFPTIISAIIKSPYKKRKQKNLIYHRQPIPFPVSCPLSPSFWQKQSRNKQIANRGILKYLILYRGKYKLAAGEYKSCITISSRQKIIYHWSFFLGRENRRDLPFFTVKKIGPGTARYRCKIFWKPISSRQKIIYQSFFLDRGNRQDMPFLR